MWLPPRSIAALFTLLIGGAAACSATSDAPPAESPDGGEPGPVEDSAPRDPGPATDSAIPDAEVDAGPTFAIDVRPSNTTCLARANAAATPPAKLSATGCVVETAPTTPAPGLIPFTVNSSFWSDGATKRRWLAMPNASKIKVKPDGDFDLPIGSVLVKEFSRAGKRIETRLFMRFTDGSWGGTSYKWDAAETDANLVAAIGETMTTPIAWTFPSRANCLTCHTEQAGRTLGLELGQLNGMFLYPSGKSANQLEALEHIDLFDAPLGKPVALLPVYPGVDDAAAKLEDRARAYLHTNCAGCHRPPTGPLGGSPDFRFQTSFANTMLCNVTPLLGPAGGPADSKRIVPGMASKSEISTRMHNRATFRMPPIGPSTTDTVGVGVVDEWINSLTACP